MNKNVYERRFGWLPDVPDHRDFSYKTIAPKIVKLPPKVDLREYCSIVENQGSIGSCVANALAGNIEFLQNKTPTPLPPQPVLTWWQKIVKWWRNRFAPRTQVWNDVSRLFVYYNARALEGTQDSDSGAFIRDGIKTLADQGDCYEDVWPYRISMVNIKPSTYAYDQAKDHIISSYHRIDTLDEMMTCLADGFPFVFGIAIFTKFMSAEVTTTGIVNIPESDEQYLGGHAIMAVGYDLETQRFLCRNSWGDNWGQNGYFTIPFDYVNTLGNDFWTIRK